MLMCCSIGSWTVWVLPSWLYDLHPASSGAPLSQWQWLTNMRSSPSLVLPPSENMPRANQPEPEWPALSSLSGALAPSQSPLVHPRPRHQHQGSNSRRPGPEPMIPAALGQKKCKKDTMQWNRIECLSLVTIGRLNIHIRWKKIFISLWYCIYCF